MNRPDEKILDIIEALEHAGDPKDVLAVFCAYVEQFGFTSVALAHLVNPALVNFGAEWFNHSTWPQEWYRCWRDKRFILHDPVASFALKNSGPFSWRQAYDYGSAFGKRILDKSRCFGFDEGLAVPIHSMNGPPGIVSLGGGRVDLSPREQACVELASRHCYRRLEGLHHRLPAEAPIRLSRRETEALHYAAAGKTNWEIGVILSIGEETVRQYMKSAARKLNCSNRTHTVSMAIQKSLIFP